MKNILIVCERYFPTIGGVEIHTYELSACLKRLGYNVQIYTFEKSIETQVLYDGIEVYYHKSYYDFLNVLKKADLIISNGEFSIKCILPSFLLGKKLISYYHMAMPYLRDQGGFKNGIVNVIRKVLASYPALNIGVTQAVIEALGLPASSPKMVIYNPLRSGLGHKIDAVMNAANQSHEHKFDLVFCGRAIEGKGIFVLAAALKKLNEQSKNVRLLIIGEGGGLTQFKSEMAQLKYIEVTYSPFLESDELLKYYKDSKIMVLPSSTHKEGSGLVLVEFMSLNKPVIISDQQAMMETIEDAGIVFKNGDAEDFADKILRLMEDTSLYLRCSRNAEHAKRKFSIKNFETNINKAVALLL